MTFRDNVHLWEYEHPNESFMDDITINKGVDKGTLLDYLLYDYGTLRAVETNSDAFHDMVINFFKVHKWNIDKLAESLVFDYDPLGNTDWRQVQDYDRGKQFGSTTDRDVNVDRTEGIDTEKHWDEHGTSHETDAHAISAFNDHTTDPKHRYTPKHLDTIDKDYEESGNETSATDDDENIRTAEDIEKNEDTKEQIDEIITKKGHDGNVSYQSLIEEERQQAQFNLYKWIGNHFANELLICVW